MLVSNQMEKKNKTNENNLLADACISCQYIRILQDGQLRWRGLADLQHTTPLGEVCTVLLVLSTALTEPVQTCAPTHKNLEFLLHFDFLKKFVRIFLLHWLTLGSGLSICSSKWYNTFVNLKADGKKYLLNKMLLNFYFSWIHNIKALLGQFILTTETDVWVFL